MDFMKLSFHVTNMQSDVSLGEAAAYSPALSGACDSRATPMSTPSARGGTGSGKFRSILLFIPLRLGQDTFNMSYADSLKVC